MNDDLAVEIAKSRVRTPKRGTFSIFGAPLRLKRSTSKLKFRPKVKLDPSQVTDLRPKPEPNPQRKYGDVRV